MARSLSRFVSTHSAGPTASGSRPALGAGFLLCALLAAPSGLRAQQVVTNTAAATYQTLAGTDSTVSNMVQTVVARPQATLQKTVSGPRSAHIGETIQYRLAYGNASSAATITNAVLTDSLPAGLDYISAQPAATVAGRTLRWALGDLAPGSGGQVVLTLGVATDVQDTLRVRNGALLASGNADSMVSLAEVVDLIGSTSRALTLTKSAELLEVGLGETAPFTLVLRNTGSLPLTDLVVHDLMPDGGRYAQGTATGADSVRAAGRDLTFYLAGPLAPGASTSVHYGMAIVSASASTLTNTAYATAEAAQVRSPDAVAWLRVRAAWPMEDRAVIGKVWADLDGDGIQEAGEPGVEGVDIWTDDGEIATTDAEGRFSYRNVRPGHHGFRLDPVSLPAAYRVADGGAGQDMVTRNASGWTTPRVDFRLLLQGGRLSSVRLPVAWRATARPEIVPPVPPPVERPRTGPTPDGPQPRVEPPPPVGALSTAPTARGNAAFGFAGSRLSPAGVAIVNQIADSLRAHDGLRVEVACHTDSIGPRHYNLLLSLARARSVQRVLAQAQVDKSRLVLRGYGPDRPVASNATREGQARNRRCEISSLAEAGSEPSESLHAELRVGGSADTFSGSYGASLPLPAPAPAPVRHLVRYEAGIRNRYAVALGGLALRFPAALDSAVVLSGDSILARGSGSTMLLPSIAAGADLRVLGWAERQGDSATVVLERDGRVLDQAFVPIADSGGTAERVIAPEFPADSLPDPAAVPAGNEIEIVLDPPLAGWPGEASFPLPAGWEIAPDSSGGTPSPSLGQDRSGTPVLFWHFGAQRQAPLVLRLRPAGAGRPVEPVRISVLRTAESRAAEHQRAFLDGPAVAIFTPGDGYVLPTDRVYVGVRGEAGAPVALFDGDSLIEKTTLRIDGVHDFIAVALEPGPHRLRVWTQNSASAERWDSIAVHVTGAPARFAYEQAPVSLAADGNTIQVVRVRVVDRWGVPVINRPKITVAATGAEPVNPDADASSVGIQVTPDGSGWLSLQLRSGRTVAPGKLRLSWAGASQELPFDVLPASQPLLLAAVGRVGVGASPDAFGAMTVRGRLDRRTSLVASYDSRRLDAGRDAFGRVTDPLEEAQYPILGDASSQRTSSASRYQLSARVERGFDWFALGDISTGGFGRELRLSGYRRALPGVAARVTTGAVAWQGFGSSTSQVLQHLQVRGAGISGPYQLGGNIRSGTEQVALETRSPDNATRVLSRQVLERFVDYQIDYEAGTLLLKQPVPAADTYGNPVFIVVLSEAETGGQRSEVWGLRTSVDGNRLLGSSLADSVRLGATWVHESRISGGHELIGADLRVLRFGGVELASEMSWSQARDSSGFAASVDGGVTLLGGAARLSASWMKAGREFGNPANVALQGGTEEVRLGGQLKQGSREFRLAHEWQQFDAQGLERRHTTGSVVQTLGPRVQVQATATADHFSGASVADGSEAGELRVQWKPEPRWTLFADGRHQFASEGTTPRPDYLGMGASHDVTRNVALDLRHRQVFLPGAGADYGVTDLGLRTRLGFGTEAYGSYQIAGVEGGHNAALVGLRNRLLLGDTWAVNGLFERRSGLDRASVFDPVRALPFLQTEEDYWSLGLGAEFLRPGSPYRLSARAEYRDGDIRSTRLATVAGDVSLNRSLAVLSRQELLRTDQAAAGIATQGHRYSTLWGVALRPAQSEAFNLLGKAQWIDADNGNGGGVLTGSRIEGRTILAGEAIWQPRTGSEVGVRYAFRRATGRLVASDGADLRLRSVADFVGWRASLRVQPLLELRADGRLLNERTSGTTRYDLAPALAFLPQQTLEIVLGYRLGDLRDPDFAVNGGHGLFLTFGLRMTEGSIASAAEFWRQRLAGH